MRGDRKQMCVGREGERVAWARACLMVRGSSTESERKAMTAATQDASGGRVHHEKGADGVGWIVLDNPGKYNAISLGMWRSLIDVFAAFDADAGVRCAVIRGEGERAFCAGADLAEKQGVEGAAALRDLDLGLAGLQALRAFAKPLVAMVSGYCLGAGMGIALECDLRIASSDASFGIPAARLGIGYPYALTKRLADLIGPAFAKQVLFTADRMPAERAGQVGLVNEVVPPAELLAFVRGLAGRIAANAPLSVAAAKQAISTACSDAPEVDIEACDARARACLASEDYAEGRRAFAEKRVPQFHGR
jgi:enoyl-CoA hydratase